MQNKYYMHENAVWGKSPHYVLQIPLDEPHEYEQMITEELGNDQYRLLCIPFFTYGFALGDVIRIDNSLELAKRKATVVKASGRFVFRLWLRDSSKAFVSRLLSAIEDMGGLWERSSAHLLAIDAPDRNVAATIEAYLADGEADGKWEFEKGGAS